MGATHHHAALSRDSFATRLSELGAPRRFAIAVSGGRDSMALAALSAALAREGRAEIVAFTVDHGLREGSAAEAEMAGGWCADLGLTQRVLDWRAEKPSSAIQAEARAARYRLLIEASQRDGCAALMTAHTRSDQVETLLMRLSRGAGVRGLSAMREETMVAAGPGAPMRLLRPLLNVGRGQVTEFLRRENRTFVDDPSNDDPRFERVRMRALLADLSFSEDNLAAAARRLADADCRLRAQEDALFDGFGGCVHGWGGVSLAGWRDEPGADGLARRLIHAAGAGDYAPEPDAAVAAIANALSAGAATLGGALVLRWKARLWFLREPAALLGRAGVAPLAAVSLDAPMVWDRRFILAPIGAGAPQIRAVGAESLGPRSALFDGPPEGLATLPGVFAARGLIGAPALPFMGDGAVAAKPLLSERFAGDVVRFG